MNIAQKVKAYYETNDFKENYASLLGEDSHYCIGRIQEILNIYYNYKISYNDAEKILKWYLANDEIRDFTDYYVGYYCIDSITFGEQHTTLDFTNHNTGKPYSKKYLGKIFEAEGFVVNKNSAYYIPSGGVMYDFRDFTPSQNDNTGRFDSDKLKEWLAD
jgi:hypothetical protein